MKQNFMYKILLLHIKKQIGFSTPKVLIKQKQIV